MTRFDTLAEPTATALPRSRFWAGVAQQAMPLAVTGSSVILLIVGVLQVEAQAMSVGALTAASLLGGRIVMFFGSIASVLARLERFRDAMGHLDDLVASASGPSASRDAPLAVAPRIVLSGLAFGDGAQGGRAPRRRSGDRSQGLRGRRGARRIRQVDTAEGAVRQPASGLGRLLGRRSGHADNEDRLWLAGVAAVKPQDASLSRGSFADTLRDGMKRLNRSLSRRRGPAAASPPLSRQRIPPTLSHWSTA
jgi:ABC-type multidrug transport system fused ATPase/permease subunit